MTLASRSGGLVARARNGLAARARDAGVRLGVIRYRPRWALSAKDWDREYSRGVLEYYGELRELGRYSALVGYVRFLGERPTILDIGCGIGLLRSRLPDEDVGRFVGLDPSEVAVEQARRAGYADSDFHVGDGPNAELGSFDIVVCNEVLYYVDDLGALFDRIASALKPGGHVLTSIFRHPGDVALHRALDRYFERVDAVDVRSHSGPRNGWRVACYRLAIAG